MCLLQLILNISNKGGVNINRIFETINGLKLNIKAQKSAVTFELVENNSKNYIFTFEFTPKTFKEILNYIENIANHSWRNLVPKKVDSFATDYYEYYDKELDNSSYLDIQKNLFNIERPTIQSNRLYKFNKKRMSTFLYDLKYIIEKEQ